MHELLLCMAALVLGPLAYQITTHKARTFAFFDGFVLIGVGGLVFVEVLPDSFTNLGITALPVALFGFLFPYVLESRLHILPVSPRTILSALIVMFLLVHQLLDGVALLVPGDVHGGHGHHDVADATEGFHLTHLTLGIILHQLPKGFFLWELVRKARGESTSIVVICALMAATAIGYFVGGSLLPALSNPTVLYFQTFIAGGLLHVVVHHVPGRQEFARSPAWSGIGALSALSIYFLLVPASEGAIEFRDAFVSLALESSPPILLGLLAAGALQAFVPSGPLGLFEGRNALTQAFRGVVIGAPLPICSCGVTPIYHTLVRRGAPVAAGLAFLIATPEIGFDSIFLSLRLLGWKMTLLRLAMAFAVAVLTGALLARFFPRVSPPGAEENLGVLAPAPGPGVKARVTGALRFGCVEMLDHIGAWLVAGVILAAAVSPYLDAEWIDAVPPGLDIVALSLCGLPLYVCASGATPLAAVLLAKGISPGAVLAFLITGPTTNVTTFGILQRLHGPRRAVAFAVTVFLLAVVFGLAVNAIAGRIPVAIDEHVTEESHGWLDLASAVVLGLLLAASIVRLGPRGFLARLGMESADRPEPKE